MERPANEQERLAALRSYAILDTPPEVDFDRLTMLAATIGGTSIAAITFVDETRLWCKSSVGIDLKETDRAISFCAHTILGQELFQVEDASKDSRFRENPLVSGGPKLAFYAGIPLISPGGNALGTLAIMDCTARSLSEFQQDMLHALARQIMLTLEHRSRENQAKAGADERELAALEKLQHSRGLLQIASRMTKLGAWEVDLATQRVFWAEEAGKAHEGSLGMSTEDSLLFHTPESRERGKQAFAACARDGTPFDHESEIVEPDGSRKWLRVIGEAVRDSHGKIVRVHGAFQNITEQKWADRAIEQSQLRFRQLADAMPQIVWTADPDGTIDYANQTLSDYTGLTQDDLKSNRWISAVHTQDVEQSVAAWSASVHSGREFSTAYRVRSAKEGSYRWHQVKAVPIRDEQGTIVKWYGTATDIHDFKSATEEIERLAGRLKATMESITDAFFTLNRSWQFTYVNSEAEQLLQRSRDSLLGNSYWDEFREAEGTVFEQEYRRAIREHCTVKFEAFYAPLNDWFEVHAYPSEEGLAVYFRNTTERKLTDRRIRESEIRFKNAARAATDAIWDWDLLTDAIWWNEGMQTMFGFPPEEVEPSGDSWTNRIHPEDRERIVAGIHAIIEGSQENWQDEYRFRRKDGSYAYVLDRGYVIREPEGTPVRMVGGMTDLTQRRQSEIELARLNRALTMRSACSDLLIRASDEQELLTEICRLAVGGGYSMAWVGYAEQDESCSIRPVAYAGSGNGQSFFDDHWLSWDEDSLAGQGPAGSAIRYGIPVLCEDVMRDASYSPWLASAQAYGYCGVICLPLRDKGNNFGLMLLYSSEVRSVAEEEVRLLQELADDVAFGLVNLRTQKEKDRLQSAVEKVAAGVSASSGEEFFKELTLNMAEALDADAGFIARIAEGETPTAHTIISVVDGQVQEDFSYALAGTPCEALLANTEWVVANRVGDLFPGSSSIAVSGMQAYVGHRLDSSAGKPLGLVFVLFRKALQNSTFASSTLRIFAARIAAELERQDTDRHIRDQASLLDKAQDAIIVRSMDSRIVYWNKGAERLYGWTAEEAIGAQMTALLDHAPESLALANSVLTEHGEWSGEVLQRHKNGSMLTVEARWTLVRDQHGQPQSILAINTDISQRKDAERAIQHLAFFDPLTHLPNRLLLLDRLQQAVANTSRSGTTGALLFIDLDNFKTLNDTLGHDMGDLLLKQVADRLTTCVRTTDTVARLGGDEFVVMLIDLSEVPHEAAAHARKAGEKILASFTAAFELTGYLHHTTPSIGITLFSEQSQTLDELLKRADLAMYQAKAAGKNDMRFFDPEMQAVMSARVALEAEFRHSLQQNDFVLYFQPQIDAREQIRGAEVLVRWQHPAKGLVAPAGFISLAEETGLIIPLGRWILETACRQLAQWGGNPSTASLSLSVNVSVRQFRHPDFVEHVLRTIADMGVAAHRLTLELTESLFVDEMETAIEKMHLLKEQGIRFSLDDFGTGYSSLFYLKRMPLNQLKIDPSFVQDVLVDPNDAVIVRTIIALGQSLGLEVTAEGVETREQLAFLAENGCYAYQGYLFSRPLPIAQFEALLDEHPFFQS
jgi:diguanylate cyclase (GGDEF)-like protein/PAS domain S-box-containing protein